MLEPYRVIPLDNEGESAINDEFGSKFTDQPLANILRYARNNLHCKSVLVEEDYIDKDYRSEFSGIYCKMFKRFDSHCKRLHFFKDELTDVDQIKKQDKETLGYSGYVTIRPIDIGKVGRTVLESSRNEPNKEYPLCTAEFQSHFLGREFTILGCPFIQQDTMVMCCAHAAIWMAARYMHERFNFPEFLPLDISEEASRYFTLTSRSLPTGGLFSLEITNALTNMGFSPDMRSKPKRTSYVSQEEYDREIQNWNPARWIYRYVESRIPVIALFSDHAATIIGHTLTHDSKPKSSTEIDRSRKINICYSDEWVDGFIVHDDSMGPYRLLPISETDTLSHFAIGQEHLLPAYTNSDSYKSLEDIQEYVVPLPEKVYILGEHIDDIVKGLLMEGTFALQLRQWVMRIAEEGNTNSLDFLKCLRDPDNPIVLRPFFLPGVQYKHYLSKLPVSQRMHPKVLKEYQNMHMSKFVWLIEITDATNYSIETVDDRKIFGEILIDATANKRGFSYLAIHLPGVLLLRNFAQDNILQTPIFIPDDHNYCCLAR